ncbi:MAG: hypothetical protein ACLT2Z_09320 [Eubacterium sp.]
MVEQYASAVGQYAEGSSDELEYLGSILAIRQICLKTLQKL